ncbi:peptidase M16 [Clostridia bacterium]|nr:peptidase M16 [Clostridia bacterium]
MGIVSEKIIKNDRLGESYRTVTHSSGCTVSLYPMKGFSSTYALFGTKYGSVDTTFKTDSDRDFLTVPEGIAHYLEHKLFENEDCDAFEKYAKTGANANAYTSFDRTAYLFSCSRAFEENLRILLGFVTSPYFTDKSVAKEQGIIGQEIKMYDDSPGWVVFFNCLEAMYANNPVRINIAGTTDSIAKIDKDLLYRCYNTFYNPHNMAIAVAGDFDPDVVLKICDELLKPELCSADPHLVTKVPDEPPAVVKRSVQQKMSCTVPMWNIGFKLPDNLGDIDKSAEVKYDIFWTLVLGDTSRFYNTSYESGIINDTFSSSLMTGRGFFSLMASGEGRNPERIYEAILDEFRKLKSGDGLDTLESEFEIVRKKKYGDVVARFDSVSSVASAMLDGYLLGVTAYHDMEAAAEVTFDDMKQILDTFDFENSTLSVVADSF